MIRYRSTKKLSNNPFTIRRNYLKVQREKLAYLRNRTDNRQNIQSNIPVLTNFDIQITNPNDILQPANDARSSPITQFEPLPSTNNQQPDNENKAQQNPTDLLLQVLQELKELKIDMTAVRQKVDRVNIEQEQTFEPPTGFPLRSLEQFDTFGNDQQRITSLQQHLEFIGGQNLRDALNKFIRTSISNDLAENFTWTGRSNGQVRKRSFKISKLAKTFFRAAKRIRRIGNFTKSEFITNFQEVLRSYKQTARNTRLPSNNGGRRNRRREDEKELFSDDNGDDDNMDSSNRLN